MMAIMEPISLILTTWGGSAIWEDSVVWAVTDRASNLVLTVKTWAEWIKSEVLTLTKFFRCLWEEEEDSEAAILDKEENQPKKTNRLEVEIRLEDLVDLAGLITSILEIWVLSAKNLSQRQNKKSDNLIIFNDF